MLGMTGAALSRRVGPPPSRGIRKGARGIRVGGAGDGRVAMRPLGCVWGGVEGVAAGGAAWAPAFAGDTGMAREAGS